MDLPVFLVPLLSHVLCSNHIYSFHHFCSTSLLVYSTFLLEVHMKMRLCAAETDSIPKAFYVFYCMVKRMMCSCVRIGATALVKRLYQHSFELLFSSFYALNLFLASFLLNHYCRENRSWDTTIAHERKTIKDTVKVKIVLEDAE